MAKRRKKTLIKSIRVGGDKFAKRFYDDRDGRAEATKWLAEMEQKREQLEHGSAYLLKKKKVKVIEAAASFLKEKSSGIRKARFATNLSYYSLLRDHVFPTRANAILTMVTTDDWLETLEGSKLKTREEQRLQKILDSDSSTETQKNEAKFKLIEEYRKRTVPTSNATKNRIRSTLSALYEHAIKVDRIAFFNPIKPIPKYPEMESQEFYSKEECIEYLTHAVEASMSLFGTRAYFIFAIMEFNWGNRMGELLGTQWKDVDWTNRHISVSKQWSRHENKLIPYLKEDRLGKQKKVKFIMMNETLMNELSVWHKETKHNAPDDFIISHPEGGRPIRPERIHDAHVETVKRAGIRYLTPHDMRHSFASHFRMNGGSLADLQTILGHSDLKQTQRYSHLSPEYVQKLSGVVSIGIGKSKSESNKKGEGE